MNYSKKVQQVKDDFELLKTMMADLSKVSELYQTTNYWSYYEKKILPELKSLGLHNFRRRKNSVLSAFGATDLLPLSQFQNRSLTGKRKIIKLITKIFSDSILSHISRAYLGLNYQDLTMFCYQLAKFYGKNSMAKPIENFEATLVGNPEDIFLINGKNYTTSLIYYYIMYAYCSKFVNFESINSFMEIGSGVGKQIEVIKKLHPHINFFIFEIPPQLYLCEQYLSAIFPDSVISYRETKNMTQIPKTSGKIFIFGNWKINEIENLNYDVFWNSASFQEMEPNVVSNYLNFVNKHTEKFAFLMERMIGKEVTNSKGGGGVLKQTTLEHYKKGLRDFSLKDMSDAMMIPNLSSKYGYKFSFWEKKKSNLHSS